MTDLAKLDLAVDSSQVDKATQSLDKFKAASGNTEKVAGDLESSLKDMVAGFRETGNASSDLGKKQDDVAKGVKSAGDAVKGMSRDIANGVSPVRALANQFENIAAGAVRLLPAVFVGIAGAVTATGAAAFFAYRSWKTYALALDDAAREAGTTIDSLSRLRDAAAFKGIDADEFAKGIKGFSGKVGDAERGLGRMAQLFRVNGLEANNFDQALESAATLIQRAGTDAERLHLLQRMGLPATMDWVRFLSQGADGIRRAKAEAVGFGNAANDSMIAKARAFDEAWNKAWTNFGTYARGAIFSALTWLDNMGDSARTFINKVAIAAGRDPRKLGIGQAQNFGSQLTGAEANSFYDAFGKTRPKTKSTVVDPDKMRSDNQLLQQYIGLLGNLATVEQQVRMQELQIDQARLNGVNITDQEKAAILEATRLRGVAADLYTRQANGIVSVDELMAVKQRELALEVFKGAMTQEQANVALANYARHARDAAEASEVYASKMPEFTRAAQDAANFDKQIDRLATGSINTLADGITDVVTGAKSMEEAFRGVAQSIIRDFTQMIVKAMLFRTVSAFMGNAGGIPGTGPAGGLLGGSIIPGILHGGGVVGSGNYPSRAVPASAFINAPRFGAGLAASAPGINEVPIIAHKGEEVGWPGQFAQKYGKPAINIVQNFDFSGAEIGVEERVKAMMPFWQRQTVNASVAAVQAANRNSPSFLRK